VASDRRASLLALLALSFVAPLASQVAPIPAPSQAGQTRDAAPAQPTERRIPVGTGSLSGTVVSADLGRPVRGARIMLSGQVTVGDAGVTGGRASGMTFTAGPTPAGLRGGGPAQMGGGIMGLSRNAVTDETGSFSFPRLPAGQFQLQISHPYYLQVNYGQRRYGGQGTYVAVADGERATVKVALERGAVITGTVLGPDGEPQRQIPVRAMRYLRTNGLRRLQAQNFVSTDDRGVYRMFGLQPGDYFIAATPNSAEMMTMDRFGTQNDLIERAIATAPVTPASAAGLPSTVTVQLPPPSQPNTMTPPPAYLPVFAPSASTVADATLVTVKPGEERSSVDIISRFTIATTVQVDLSSPLEPGVHVQFSMTNDDPSVDNSDGGQMREQNGRVFFRGLRPGKYTLFAQTVPGPPQFVPGQAAVQPPGLSDAQKMWASIPVEVTGVPLQNVSVTLRPSRSISGVVVFDTTRVVDLTRSRVSVTLSPAPSGTMMYFNAPAQAQVGPDGRFTLTGVMAGRYTLRASGGGSLRSSMVGGQDTLDIPLDFTGDRDITDAVITMADWSSDLRGTLTDSTGKPAIDHSIVVVSTDNRYWVPGSRRIAVSRPSPDGRYAFGALAPGAYFLAAVLDLESGAQFDPEFLRQLAAASVPVTITEGGKVVQDLRVK
jgi:hypothetical protein